MPLLPRSISRHTDRLLGRIPVTIQAGENAGMKWSLASAGAGYRSGTRAAAQMELLTELLVPGDTFWDVGAHHGYMSLCAAQRVGEQGRVHAFEPCARSFEFLELHVDWNDLENISLHPYALGSYDGTAAFGGTGSSKGYFLGGGDEEVEVRTADTLVTAGECPPPTFAKIDVEGAECEMLTGARDALRPDCRLLIAVHSRNADDRCREMLGDLGFTMLPSRALTACREGEWARDPDLLCFGPEYDHTALDVATASNLGF